MPLPSTPPISLTQIQTEVGLGPGSSLIDCLNASFLADKSLPVPMTRFLGYTHTLPPPASVTATRVSSEEINVEWVSGGGLVDWWRIEVNINNGGWTFVANQVVGFEYVYSAEQVGVPYQFRVRAENAGNVSDWTYSNIVNM